MRQNADVPVRCSARDAECTRDVGDGDLAIAKPLQKRGPDGILQGVADEGDVHVWRENKRSTASALTVP